VETARVVKLNNEDKAIVCLIITLRVSLVSTRLARLHQDHAEGWQGQVRQLMAQRICCARNRKSNYYVSFNPARLAEECSMISNRHVVTGRLNCANVILYAGIVVSVICSIAIAGPNRGRRGNTLVPRDFFEGKALFEKSWEPGKPSAVGGDGLGPLYNEVSCVGCHHQGGTGGGGENDHNVEMVTAVSSSTPAQAGDALFQGELEDLHPGFRNRRSIVIHKHATTEMVQKRLTKIKSYTAVQTREETLVLRKAERNTPALFGAGTIDQVSDEVLRQAEKRVFPKFPEIKGRVSELPDGRLGRFGWKGQIATLDDFVRAACSNELGLEVPGKHQVSLASAEEFDPTKVKLDMNEEQCELLTTFLARLAPPARGPVDDRRLPPWGSMVFESIGCATCHAPALGGVRGIYSDLLLHDMGESSSDTAVYYGAPTAPQSLRNLADSQGSSRPSGMAGATEWRTPPLWGVAESAPYLHDGRANTLDDAIRLHGGEADKTTSRYTKLASTDRRALLRFLSSLTVSPLERKPPSASRRRGNPGVTKNIPPRALRLSSGESTKEQP
jgi:CxxC motif-containing protein (DUF1111 family)